MKMKITAYYRPPKQVSDIDNKLFKEEINGLSIKRKKDILIIGGDFNLPDICWSEQSIQTNQYPTHTNQAYLDTIADNGLEQLVDFPTRKENTLDLFFTTRPSFKQRCKPLPSIGNSDHDIVLLDVACKPVKPKPTRRKIYLWKKAEVHNIQKDIAEFGSTFKNETHQNIESMWQSFKTEIKYIIDKRVKVITKLPNSEQSYKGKVQTHNYINRQNQSTTGKL